MSNPNDASPRNPFIALLNSLSPPVGNMDRNDARYDYLDNRQTAKAYNSTSALEIQNAGRDYHNNRRVTTSRDLHNLSTYRNYNGTASAVGGSVIHGDVNSPIAHGDPYGITDAVNASAWVSHPTPPGNHYPSNSAYRVSRSFSQANAVPPSSGRSTNYVAPSFNPWPIPDSVPRVPPSSDHFHAAPLNPPPPFHSSESLWNSPEFWLTMMPPNPLPPDQFFTTFSARSQEEQECPSSHLQPNLRFEGPSPPRPTQTVHNIHGPTTWTNTIVRPDGSHIVTGSWAIPGDPWGVTALNVPNGSSERERHRSEW